MASLEPSLKSVLDSVSRCQGNLVPIYRCIGSDLMTPMVAYLKLSSNGAVLAGERIGRYSFLGSNPRSIFVTNDQDPLDVIQAELGCVKYVTVPGLPDFTGGAVGYVSYDCVKYFEPTVKSDLKDTIGIPEATFLWMDTIVLFDHLYSTIKIVSHLRLPENASHQEIAAEYARASLEIKKVHDILASDKVPLPVQDPIILDQPAVSNVGQAGYEGFVKSLKTHIASGDIIQCVPSQRIRKNTNLHPLNAYRQLRAVNPSPYMFYLDLVDFQVVGASPEMLVKVENRQVYTHPIAGTRKRGKTPELDAALEAELLGDIKERSEHVMLVDLGRNDVNRVCDPNTVNVEKYAHVMHLVSHVTGTLRDDQTQFDAFRSIFPAGTVSGAPKVRAMQLISELEKEKRNIYAGAVGYFGYSGGTDTCIAIRTMLFKDGQVIFQAGGGIVYDSDPTLEFEETINKLKSNVTAIENAERYHYSLQNPQ